MPAEYPLGSGWGPVLQYEVPVQLHVLHPGIAHLASPSHHRSAQLGSAAHAHPVWDGPEVRCDPRSDHAECDGSREQL